MVCAGEGLWPLAHLSPTFVVRLAVRFWMPNVLPRAHPTAIAFLDESGSISNDRFFAVGCLKVREPSELTRAVQRVRDRWHWYNEIHFTDLTRGALPFYKAVLAEVSGLRARFSCFIADRDVVDPMARFGSSWKAYEALACQLLHGSIERAELVTVLADYFSMPAHVVFEQDLRREINRRLDRLAVTSVCLLNSRSADALQTVDLLTSAVTFEFRQRAGLAGTKGPKAKLAAEVRAACGATTFLNGFKSPPGASLHFNVARYRDRWPKAQRG